MSKLVAALRAVGVRGVWRQLWLYKDVKVPHYVGTDHMGNKYFEASGEHSFGRQRFMEPFHGKRHADAQDMAPEWHSWMHRIIDEPPNSPKNRYVTKQDQQADWITKKFVGNPTGTSGSYKPYSTVKSKITEWQPTIKERL